jgi:carboxymethylenebutenolidase
MMATTAEDLAPYERWRTSYRSDDRELAGFWLTPPGDEPVPAVVFNHGSNGLLAASLPGVQALVALGYAVFLPVRRGHSGQPGPFWLDRITNPWGSPEMGEQLVAALRDELRDVLAAVRWTVARPEVASGRLALVGSSFGGVLTVLALATDTPVSAGVSFAGPSMTWPHAPALQQAMLAAARVARAPLFLAQASNDNSLAPTYAIGAELARAGHPHETRVYPPVGDGPGGGHGIFGTGVDLWRSDIEAFLTRWVGPSAGAGGDRAANLSRVGERKNVVRRG